MHLIKMCCELVNLFNYLDYYDLFYYYLLQVLYLINLESHYIAI